MNVISGLVADIENGLHISSLSSVFSSLTTVVTLMEENYVQDKNARNAAIDTIIDLLQKLKT
jgi:hypothetical protein